MVPGPSDDFHSENEVEINRLDDYLGFEDCGSIFEKVRFENRKRALYLVEAYVDEKRKAKS